MKYIIVIFLSVSFQNLFGQKLASDYFEEGNELLKLKDYQNAIVSYRYIVTNHSKNQLYSKAYYNLGYSYYLNNQIDSASIVFKKILNSNFNEKENSGRSIMENPFANYCHYSSELLSKIYYDKKDFDTSLYYLSLSDTTFPLLTNCGNAFAENQINYAIKYSDLFQKLHTNEKAIQKLLKAIFITDFDNSKIILELNELLKGKKDLKKKLKSALKKVYPHEFLYNGQKYNQYYFQFLNTEIEIPFGYDDQTYEFDSKLALKEIENSKFYKMIMSL